MAGEAVTTTMGRRRRWWVVRALRGHPLARLVDRLEALAVVAAIVLVAGAVFAALACHDVVYASRSETIAAEATARHPVEATAIHADKPKPRGPGPASTAQYSVHVEWFAQNATRDGVVKADRVLKPGDRLRIWVDDRGEVTRAPRTDADARADAAVVSVLLWLLCAAVVAGAMAALRRALDRVRYRGWDRSLRLLIEDSGGSSTRRP
jgi:hypothetical protein